MKEKEKEILHKFLGVKNESSSIEREYLQKAKKTCKFLRFVPWILFVWVWNSLAMKSGNKNSDIDLFIISSENRIWTVRIFTTLYFFLIWERKNNSNHAGKFCLSFFVSEKNLSFESFALKNDYYLMYRIQTLLPIVNYNWTYKAFLESNTWALEWKKIEHYCSINTHYMALEAQKNNRKSFLADYLEKWLKKIFLKKTLKSQEKLGKPFGIIVSDDVLKFHNNDKRIIIREHVEQYTWKIKNIL